MKLPKRTFQIRGLNKYLYIVLWAARFFGFLSSLVTKCFVVLRDVISSQDNLNSRVTILLYNRWQKDFGDSGIGRRIFTVCKSFHPSTSLIFHRLIGISSLSHCGNEYYCPVSILERVPNSAHFAGHGWCWWCDEGRLFLCPLLLISFWCGRDRRPSVFCLLTSTIGNCIDVIPLCRSEQWVTGVSPCARRHASAWKPPHWYAW